MVWVIAVFVIGMVTLNVVIYRMAVERSDLRAQVARLQEAAKVVPAEYPALRRLCK